MPTPLEKRTARRSRVAPKQNKKHWRARKGIARSSTSTIHDPFSPARAGPATLARRVYLRIHRAKARRALISQRDQRRDNSATAPLHPSPLRVWTQACTRSWRCEDCCRMSDDHGAGRRAASRPQRHGAHLLAICLLLALSLRATQASRTAPGASLSRIWDSFAMPPRCCLREDCRESQLKRDAVLERSQQRVGADHLAGGCAPGTLALHIPCTCAGTTLLGHLRSNAQQSEDQPGLLAASAAARQLLQGTVDCDADRAHAPFSLSLLASVDGFCFTVTCRCIADALPLPLQLVGPPRPPLIYPRLQVHNQGQCEPGHCCSTEAPVNQLSTLIIPFKRACADDIVNMTVSYDLPVSWEWDAGEFVLTVSGLGDYHQVSACLLWRLTGSPPPTVARRLTRRAHVLWCVGGRCWRRRTGSASACTWPQAVHAARTPASSSGAHPGPPVSSAASWC